MRCPLGLASVLCVLALSACASEGTKDGQNHVKLARHHVKLPPPPHHGPTETTITIPGVDTPGPVRPTRVAAPPPKKVAPLPPPVPDPKPSEAVTTAISPGAPSDAEVRRELAQAMGLKGADASKVGDAASITADGLAISPADAPTAVDLIIRGGNRVAHAPYIYGGGHGTWQDTGYDCSGSVSFALAAAGLLSHPLDSTALERYGDPGPGKWVTIFANAGHAYMYVAGLRFDTSGRSGPRGSRWQVGHRSNAGFVARHPPGL